MGSFCHRSEIGFPRSCRLKGWNFLFSWVLPPPSFVGFSFFSSLGSGSALFPFSILVVDEENASFFPRVRTPPSPRCRNLSSLFFRRPLSLPTLECPFLFFFSCLTFFSISMTVLPPLFSWDAGFFPPVEFNLLLLLFPPFSRAEILFNEGLLLSRRVCFFFA